MEMALFQKQEAWEEAAEVCVQIGRSNWDWMKRNLLKLFRTRAITCAGHWEWILHSCLQTNVQFHYLWLGKWVCEYLLTHCLLWKSTAQAWLYFIPVSRHTLTGRGSMRVLFSCSFRYLAGSESHTAGPESHCLANCFLTCKKNQGCKQGTYEEETLRAFILAPRPDPPLMSL